MATAQLALHDELAAPPSTISPGRSRRDWAILVGKVSLLIGLLSLHFASRWQRSATMPLADRHNYERAYVYSLSLLAGRGFHDMAIPDSPAAAPIARFLDKESDRVTADEFAAYLSSARPTDANAVIDEHTRWVSSRVLDHYVVAGLWRLFGIRWDVVLVQCQIMSTLVCLLAFFIGCRLGGGYWAGMLAALMFFVSPLESQLQAWSLRDVSPLWFEAIGFWFLLCVLDRDKVKSTGRILLGSAILGFLTMSGFGWRPDVLLTVLYLALALPLLSWLRGIRWPTVMTAVGVYCVGVWGCHAAIYCLIDEPSVDSQNGFHMAVYADFSRANLLKIENSFQIQRCDRATMFLARQHEWAVNPEGPPLSYLGARYSHVCRDLFFQEAQYNAFRLASKFPGVYWRSLAGLKIPGAFATLDTQQLREGRLPWLSAPYKVAFDPLAAAAPWLYLLGLFVATALGPARMQSALLGGITILQCVALLLVLPEQKHLATLQLPLSIFAGIGLWTLLKLTRRSHWPRLSEIVAWRPSKAWLAVVAGGVAIWGATCLGAYFFSRHQRQYLIDSIQTLARDGEPAPETIRNEKVFSVRMLPHSPVEQSGYLLKIMAGDNPGTLLCRHIHFPQDWCWPRSLDTLHRLEPGRDQFFFVSCMQAAEFGDPRPYSCSVFLNGDARIESCVRVDLNNWRGLQISTLFYDGQNSPGSPRAPDNNSVMRWPNWPAIRSSSDNDHDRDKYAMKTLYDGPESVPPSSSPLHHLIAQDAATGAWDIAVSDGRKFSVTKLNYWSPQGWSRIVSGDFSGGGLSDLLGQRTDGSWWLGRANGNLVEFALYPLRLPDQKFDFVGVGDFNGDGIDDVAARSASDGAWWIGLSRGAKFDVKRWGHWPRGIPPEKICIADFDGDGRADLAGLDPKTGDWIVSKSDGTKLETHVWGALGPKNQWSHAIAADFVGDGRNHVAAMNATTGEWILGRSDGKQFDCKPAGRWPANLSSSSVQTGRFTPDGRQSLLATDPQTGDIAIATFDGKQFVTRHLSGNPALCGGAYIGDFNGSGQDQIVGISKQNELMIGVLQGDSIRFEHWGVWPGADHQTDRRVIPAWRK